MRLPELKIGNKTAKIPIVQGGMAIRLSTARLAAAVAQEGGIGLIAASGMAHEELRYEIKLARSLTDGIIGINIMVAASDFFGIVRTAMDAGIDLIVAGAGFSRDIFGLGKRRSHSSSRQTDGAVNHDDIFRLRFKIIFFQTRRAVRLQTCRETRAHLHAAKTLPKF